jgi:phosphopantothenoylcysteine decarboxylase / phosphopantothenate---cysteine ligase
MLTGKHIILGVTGGIAAYKSALIVRECVRAGAEVQVIMTRSATQFVTPLTFATLSRREVVIEMFPPAPDQPTMQWTKHIDLALWADIMLVAPASANTIAKIAHGLADNFLTALVLALRCPLVVAPSMDVDMYKNPVTQNNLAILRGRGCHIIEPATGELASGLTGAGRLPEPDALVSEVNQILEHRTRDLTGVSILVTAGPTQEPIDPVRYVGNRSSGKMGFAVARAAAERGATTTLIAGPVHLDTPPGVRRIDVTTAREMYDAVMSEFPACNLLVMAAAVADFAPVAPSRQKIKREGIKGDRLSIECVKNRDILKAAAARKENQVVMGFALETTHEMEHARKKLSGKKLDMIVVNNPTVEGAGFGADTNVVTLVHADGHAEELPRQSKLCIAHEILNRAVPLLRS